MAIPLSFPDNAQLEAKLNALQETVDSFQSLPARIAELERVVLGTDGRAGYFEVASALQQAHEITRDVYSRQYRCAEKEDSEISGERYFEFQVADDGNIGDVIARDTEWHRRIAGLPANAIGLFRLAIDARK